MPSYETEYKCGPSPQGYSIDQYEASDSSSSSPQTHYSLSCLKTRESYPTSSTDSSNEPDDSAYYNFPAPTANTFIKMGENGITNFLYSGNQMEQFFNQNDGRVNLNGENFMQSYSMANFDPNFESNRLSTNSLKSEPEKKSTRLSPSPVLQNNEVVSQQYLMQPPDSDSIEAATANAKKKRPQRRSRTKFEKEQLDILESTFQKTHYPDVNMIDRISRMCNLTTERISVWFQNRRARFKRTKKGQKEEPVIPDHNPILEELGLYNTTELEKNSNLNKFDEPKIENAPSPLDDNTNESEVNHSEENICQPQKPLFNPITLPTNKNSQNSSQNYYMPFNKTEPHYYQDDSNQHERSQINEPTDEHNSSYSPSSRNSSPKPQSNISTPSPDPEQTSQNTYAQLPSVINHYNSLPSMMNYQSGLGSFYMPPIQTYAQNLPGIFQPYMDYKPDIANLSYFHGFNPQTLPSYYGSF